MRGVRILGRGVIRRWYSIKRPQYDFKRLRTEAEMFQQSVEKRQMELPGRKSVPEVMGRYKELVEAKRRRDELLFERNQLQKQIKDKESAQQVKERLGELKSDIKRSEETVESLEEPVMESIESIPNEIDPEVVQLEDVVEVDRLNPDAFVAKDEKRDHMAVAEKLGGLVDFGSGSQVSGASWYYLLENGALLEMALVQYAISKARARGWRLVVPPAAVRPAVANACGFKPRDQHGEQQIYSVGDSLCLAGTAEIPLAGLGLRKTLDALPERVVGVSRAYRAEAGARGRDTKGLYRVHEFTKVELFAWCRPEESEAMLNEILELQKDIVRDLGLCARVLDMPPYELGAPASRKYDIEAWMPGRGDWGEISSASNCLSFQSRRLHTKCEDGQFTHTLNGTAMAVPRMIVAIIENFYDPATNAIQIPTPLRKYLDDVSHIHPVK
jgi:seryl-tRNA synthetase